MENTPFFHSFISAQAADKKTSSSGDSPTKTSQEALFHLFWIVLLMIRFFLLLKQSGLYQNPPPAAKADTQNPHFHFSKFEKIKNH
jgi:hypothetical protein